MIDSIDIEKLAQLARIKINDQEKESLGKEIDSILAYVDQLKTASADAPETSAFLRNVFREDSNPHESGIFTAALLKAAPKNEGAYVKVKKIL